MNLYIFSDESGTFDANHNDYFIFGGLICFSENEKEFRTRQYAHVETIYREHHIVSPDTELKASYLSNAHRGKFYRSLNGAFKFAVIIHQQDLDPRIFHTKKHKQRYQDYAYKLVLKKCFEHLIERGYIRSRKVTNIYVYCDEHHTATDGVYELRENLLSEFQQGTFSSAWCVFHAPVFEHLLDVEVHFCDSKKVYLVRAADIIANHFYHQAIAHNGEVEAEANTFIFNVPANRILSTGEEYFLAKRVGQNRTQAATPNCL